MRFANEVCGEPHPDFVFGRLTLQQFHEIRAYYRTELLPGQRAALEQGFSRLVAARAGGAKGCELDDFVIDSYPEGRKVEEEEQTPEEMDRQMRKVAGLFAATQSKG